MSYNISDTRLLYSPLLQQMPGWMFIKSREFKYTSSTLRSSILCGFKHQQDKLGKSDFELNCAASESAEFFQAQDKKVINSGREISFLQLNEYADNKTHVFLTKKSPLRNSHNKIIGVCGVVEEVVNPTIAQAILKLANQRKLHINNMQRKNFQIDANDIYDQLSARESEIIFYLIRGFSNKGVSSFIRLSSQVIESNLENIKNKLSCSSLNDLINYCLIHGCSNVIPHTILRRYINETITINSAIIPVDSKHNLLPTDCNKLSPRQRECLYYLAEGLSTKEIARKLNLSSRTVDSYIENMKKKFNCRSRYGLIIKLLPIFSR